jgi:hypothetical protein
MGSGIAQRKLLLPIVFVALGIIPAEGQGFGKLHKKVTLHRKLPAAVQLSGTTISVKTGAREAKNTEVAQQLTTILETELLKNDSRLQIETGKAATAISCVITNLSIPPVQAVDKSVLADQKIGKDLRQVQQTEKFNRVTGSMDVAYRATSGSRTVDSENVSAKYAEDFEQGTGRKGDKSWSDVFKKPFDKLNPSKNGAEQGQPTPSEVQQKLLHDVAVQIAARLVNTDEPVEVFLARGKLDSANKLAESGLWTRDLETLEQMTPFPSKEEDAYRLYNIGVAYEALAYQAADAKTARKYLDEAAINYGKAIDNNAGERAFIEPQRRIETALAHYKRLEETAVAKAEPPDVKSEPSAKTRHAKPSAPKPGAGSKPGADSAAKSGGPPLTNEQVVKLKKAGMDEQNLIETINSASRVDFDMSVDGELELVKNGVNGKVLSAMRQRARLSARRRAPQ